MFIFLAVISMLSYSLQAVLMAQYARSMDALSCAIYRNISLVFSMLPLLLLVPPEEFSSLSNFYSEFILAGILGGIALSCAYYAMNFFPVGIVTAVSSSIRVAMLLVLGFIFFAEEVAPIKILFLSSILCTSLILAFQNYRMPHLKEDTKTGFLFVLIAGVLGSAWFLTITHISREINPFMTGYFLEMTVGMGTILIGFLRFLFTGIKVQKISRKDFQKISLFALPTVLGTSCFALATRLGPIGLLSGIGTGSMISSSFMSYLIFRERLEPKHWLGISVVSLAILGIAYVD